MTEPAPIHNWAGNVTFTPDRVVYPAGVEQLQEVVAGAERLRVLGSGHSFNTIADTSGLMVSVRDLPERAEFDAATGEITVSAGLTYGAVGAHLQRLGRALHNTGSLPHISVGGACSTGTHGSGNRNRSLPAAVAGVEFVGADGELHRLTRRDDPETFGGAVVVLGRLGVVTALTLDTEPTYDVAQDVWRDVPFAAVRDRFDEVSAAGYSVSVFTDWRRPDVMDKVWVKRRTDRFTELPPDWLGGWWTDEPAHPINGVDPAAATEQAGRPGPWNARLPHFRMELTPSNGDEMQSEYMLDRRDAAGALDALHGLAPLFAGVLMVFELRTIAADQMWLSPAYGRDTVALHFTWTNDMAAVQPVLARIESALAPWQPRPHWAKVFTIPDDQVRSRYERMADALALIRHHDPDGTFGNAFTDRYLPATG